MYCGFDVGSTTCKYVLCTDAGDVLARRYERHGSKQADKVREFLAELEERHNFTPRRDRIFLTGSGAGVIAPLIGGKVIQEVVAVAAAVERLHPAVRFVSEIGGEDMKTIFFQEGAGAKSKQVFMQSACSGGTGTFIEKTARKLGVADQLPRMGYAGYTVHKISSKCGIFAEADANTLVKAGVSIEEIIASLYEAVVYQNLATLTKGNTPLPEVLLLGGPNLFFAGLQEAWRAHLRRLWHERRVPLPPQRDVESLVLIPDDALYYAALGCVAIGRGEPPEAGLYQGYDTLSWWIGEGQYEQKKKEGSKGLWTTVEELEAFKRHYRPAGQTSNGDGRAAVSVALPPCVVGCDFGSTTAKAVCLSPAKEVLFTCYALSKGNPIEDAKSLFAQIRAAGAGELLGVGVTGYGAELLKNIIGADAPVVETVAHAAAALHFFPDADCICDVGGVDVKILILKNGTVADFRLNSQCSSGNGAFLQGVAERFDIPLAEVADRAFTAQAVPSLTMGCGVFLQSDIVNQQRKGWQADEILAGLCRILPLNVWVYAGGLNNLAAVGKKFILQGGTHKNLAVVKAQVDFIRGKIPDAEIVVHPYSGEAGAIGAALCALERWESGEPTRFRGFEVIAGLTYRTTTAPATVCTWCPVHCQRTFIDVEIPGGTGRTWSKVPLPEGWERVIANNSCPKGLVEDVNELRVVKAEMEKTHHAYPNVAEMVRKQAFRPVTA
ncbi:MAG: BadF/BadG/BcrA/BcrD ATPase family protein [Thermodesulfobacteriota bacterium]|jgi:predicted CoA-substrate-specific enzyme activase